MYEFRLPDIGEGLHEAEIVRWLVRPGEVVRADQPMVEVQTDKALVEIPCPVSGVIAEIRVPEGRTVPVGTVLVVIAPAAAALGAAAAGAPRGGAVAPGATHAPDTPGVAVAAGAVLAAGAPAAGAAPSPSALVPGAAAAAAPAAGAAPQPPRILAAPSVRKAAREMGIDLAQVRGTGPAGRITMADLEAHAAARRGTAAAPAPAAPAGTPAAPPAAPAVAEPGAAAAPAPLAPAAAAAPAATAAGPREEAVPLVGLRRRIAERLSEAWRTIPHVTIHEEVDATALVDLRQRLAPAAEARGVRLTYMPFVIKAVTVALKEHPYLNATFDEAGGRIILKRYYHIGVATAIPDGLLVPVVRDADRKSLLQLAGEVQHLAERARARQLAPQELTGSTFTITNFGRFGGWLGTPIINPPEVAILGTGRIANRPVAEGDRVAVRPILPLSLSFDHRVIDGEGAARFLARVVELLRDPALLMLEMV